jgi:hypothetical protein
MKPILKIVNKKSVVSALLLLVFVMPACTLAKRTPAAGKAATTDADVADKLKSGATGSIQAPWHVSKTPVDNSVDSQALADFDLTKASAKLNDAQTDFVSDLLAPLSRILLNGKFIGDPSQLTVRLQQMLQVFHQALLHQMDKDDTSAKFAAIKVKYLETVFAGCTCDFKSDCTSAAFFAQDTRFSRILTGLAGDLDSKIDAEIKSNQTSEACVANSESCRNLLETRYRILAMALYPKGNSNDDLEYTSVYLKYARPFALLLDYDPKAAACAKMK